MGAAFVIDHDALAWQHYQKRMSSSEFHFGPQHRRGWRCCARRGRSSRPPLQEETYSSFPGARRRIRRLSGGVLPRMQKTGGISSTGHGPAILESSSHRIHRRNASQMAPRQMPQPMIVFSFLHTTRTPPGGLTFLDKSQAASPPRLTLPSMAHGYLQPDRSVFFSS